MIQFFLKKPNPSNRYPNLKCNEKRTHTNTNTAKFPRKAKGPLNIELKKNKITVTSAQQIPNEITNETQKTECQNQNKPESQRT